MTTKTTLPVMMAIALLALAGCPKKETAATPPDTSAGSAIGVAPTASAAAGGVASYADMVPQGGTKMLLQSFTVYQAADTASPVLSHVSTGQWINLKGSHGNWMLIEWPSGVGQMSPGWIELRGGVNDSRLGTSPPPDAGAPPPVVVDAGAPPPVVDAGAPKDAGTGVFNGRDAGTAKPTGIVIKPRH